MRIAWQRPSTTLIVSFIALCVALSGSAIAVSRGGIKAKHIDRNAVRSKQLAPKAVKSVHVRDAKLKGRDIKPGSLSADLFGDGELPQGPTGAQGEKGESGPPGPPGDDGDDGLTIYTGGALLPATNGDHFAPPFGTAAALPMSDDVRALSPAEATNFTNLFVRVSGTLSAQSVAVTVRVGGVDTSLSCAVPPSGSCVSSSSVPVPANSQVSVKIDTFDVANTKLSWRWEVEG